MTKPTAWTKRFEASCRKWQVTLGLTDWTLAFKVDKSNDNNHEADVTYGCDSRHATLTAYVTSDALSPERVALHEMLHLLFADMLDVAGKRGSDHADLGREEHRAIERLLNALDGRP